jgi:acetyl/propionyl-CoA carboxylase alpha subunit
VVRRVLIANRGEIAVRVVQACRERDIEAVAACTDAELDATAASLADEVAVVTSYLDAGALVDAARSCGADAVHPGYGFLSEDPRFAEAVEAAGLTWIGPPPHAMRALGDKERAREIAEAAGVPVVPGATGDDFVLVRAGSALGPPLLVKASAGGGGRGMRAVDDVHELRTALASARQEAKAAFGDDRVFLERRIGGGRHVEVQILADAEGRTIHLGERDCSLQRRHQKVIEESPAPGVSEALRAKLGDAAIAVASAARYRSAGTVEFLLMPDGSFSFLEMNARLQVEHPVTEAVTGVDLVAAQLAIAAGEPLPFDQASVSLGGHSIEARIYAEDPANGFLPTGGRVRRLELPRWPGVRIDTALREGDEVTLAFDPLLAKVIAWAGDRGACIRKLRAALAATAIVGVPTNIGFLLDVLAHPDVRAASVDTEWVEREWRGGPPALPAGVAATRADTRDPWHRFGTRAPSPPDVVVADGWAQHRGWAYQLAEGELEHVALAPPGGSLVAPMPATVHEVHVSVGDRVGEGDAVVTLEAMKMQLAVRTPSAGVVSAVRVRAGDVVSSGAVLVELEEERS